MFRTRGFIFRKEAVSTSGVPRNFFRGGVQPRNFFSVFQPRNFFGGSTQGIFSLGSTQEFFRVVQQIQLRTEVKENGDLGSVAPYSGVLEAAIIWYKKFHFI
jgi:hypothetical protein